jgi:hypothetical protein
MANFTIDDLEIERVEDHFTYTAKSGRVYEFTDPRSLDGRTALAFQQGRLTAEDALVAILGGDEFDDFMDEDEVDGYLLDPLLTKWAQHYGMNLEPGKAPRSSSRSTGSRKNSKRTSPTGTKGSR